MHWQRGKVKRSSLFIVSHGSCSHETFASTFLILYEKVQLVQLEKVQSTKLLSSVIQSAEVFSNMSFEVRLERCMNFGDPRPGISTHLLMVGFHAPSPA